ncbi:MAG: F0F1 ATP synthase subunit I [Gammaproteobacteria bacterium]
MQKVLKLFFVVQLTITLGVVITFGLMAGQHAAYSAALGGITCLLPNMCFAWFVLRYRGARQAKKIVQSFYRGEAFKLLITVGLFFIAFKFAAVKPLPFFVNYIAGLAVYWVAPLLLRS